MSLHRGNKINKMLRKFLIIFAILVACICATPANYAEQGSEIPDNLMHPNFARKISKKAAKQVSPAELTKDYWINNAKATIAQRLAVTKINQKAKNVILFLGDGMAHATLAAARVVLGNESKKLSFEKFPYTASSKTYCVNSQVPDSACTATAFMQGIKTNLDIVGLTSAATYDNCDDQNIASKRSYSIGKWFLDQGKSAGVVTTATITHATPAGVYANAANRDWEGNQNVRNSKCDDTLIDDIAEQLVHGQVGSRLKVALGGGSRFFVNTTVVEHGANGARTDGKNLINEWLAAKSGRQFVRNRSELLAVDSKVDQLFGLFDSCFMQFNLDVRSSNQQSVHPTLTDMAVKAVDVLSQDKRGYFLLVEGGRIDHGHHFTQSRYAVDELIEFHKSIEAVLSKVDLKETLVVVTADHGHVFSFGGYAARGNDVFGTAGMADDGMSYFTLSYANGPGFYYNRGTNGRLNPNAMTSAKDGFTFPATVPLYVETHGGDDVGIWAIGAQAHEFKGVIEQNVIAQLMARAACVGAFSEDCQH